MQTQTDWESAYQRRETPWEKGRAHPALVDFLAENGPLAGEIFVPGCGSGHDVRALSDSGNHVVGIDIAPLAIAQASSFPKTANEEYRLADLFALPPEYHEHFDHVFEHTCFCAIDPARRPDYVEAIVRLLKPGGRFRAIFFLDPDNDEDGPPYRVSRKELQKLFGERFAVESEWIPKRTHAGREARELFVALSKRSVG